MPDVLLNSTLLAIAAAFALGALFRGFSNTGLPPVAMPVLAGLSGKVGCLTLFAFLGNYANGAAPENAAAADTTFINAAAADTIFINGDVVTMDAQGAVVAAVAVKDGRITHVGNPADLLAYRSAATEMVDLQGGALLPGFIDSHSHVTMVAAKLAAADLSPKPAGAVVSFADIRAVLRKHIDSNPPDNDDWVVGWGYDHSMLAENRHPTRTDLDRLSTKHPIVLVHFSGHQAVLNSNGLARVGYTSDTPDPEAGVIQRRPGSTEPNGIVEEQAYRGYPRYEDQQQVNRLVAKYYRRNLPLNIHALGDATIDQAITAIQEAERDYPAGDRRTNLIHLQVLREDQLDALRKLDVTLTFQVAHNYYFGDLHREWTLGPERAANLNPARSALDRGIVFTIHHDAPIHPVDQLMLIWTAVNRVTRSGAVLGPGQRISVLDALRASTINAAYQHFEEDRKGSIEVGKLADLVVLSANPLAVDPMTIKDLEVLATYKEGQAVFRKGR